MQFTVRPSTANRMGGVSECGQNSRARGPIILIIIMMTSPRGIPKHPRAQFPNRCTYLNARNQYSVLSPENTQDSP